ncbi:MAG: FkbM family methyltransferase [Labilithrix sp.]|nr:FkbM family methyltransferase [Labilithrix sp.]MCW5810489.1 FkbM family methyltransferase [Labilithrix sp.]
MEERDLEKLGFANMLETLSLEARGVVYAGAHRGEHVPELREAGYEHMLLVEPNADDFAHLQTFTSAHVRCVQVALTDREGPLDYWAAPGRFAVLNSILEPDEEHFSNLFARASPTEGEVRFEKRTVQGTTLDALLATDDAPYNLFYLNVQGAVLPALKGSSKVLSRFDVVVCEAELVSRYRNAPLFAELEPWMKAHGFMLSGLSRSEDAENDFGMACFLRIRR